MGLALFLFMFTNSLFPLVFSDPFCHDDEQSALIQFKESFIIDMRASGGSSAYPKVEKWKINGEQSDCCLWDGVICDNSTNHVIGLDLSSSYLYGSLNSNSSLFQLVYISHLNLANNNFNHSPIPSMLGQLLQLTYLNLSSSGFSGQIPSGISQLANLSLLDLSNNGGLVLRKPDLATLVQNLTVLQHLDLGFVEISSKVPDILANLTSLESLVLTECGLSGQFPKEVFQLPNLKSLDMAMNWDLQGQLPQFNSSSPLQRVILEHTSFSGGVPASIGELMSLEEFNIYNCSFSGYVPSSFGNLTEMSILDFTGNMFQGSLPIPPPFIQIYLIGGNNLTGQLSSDLCSFSSLNIFVVSDNNLSGKLPKCLGNFSTSLQALSLDGNNFHGEIPDTYTEECSLKVLELGQNKLRGELPRSLANCSKLESLFLDGNEIEDAFPSWLGALQELKVLILRSNLFHGVLESHKTDLVFPKLQIIDLSQNHFAGQLPAEYFVNWNAMKVAKSDNGSYWTQYLYTDYISGGFVTVFTYPLSLTNKGIKTESEKMFRRSVAVDLSGNRFEGQIPQSLGDLNGLHLLNLSNNILTGPIPSSLANLSELEALDVSENKLSGEIPQELAQLTFLSFFNASHNHLRGPIPHGGQFDTFENSSYIGNSGLCGGPLSKKCESPPPHSSSLTFGWTPVAIGYASGFAFGIGIGHIIYTKKREWIVKVFGEKRPMRRVVRGIGQWN